MILLNKGDTLFLQLPSTAKNQDISYTTFKYEDVCAAMLNLKGKHKKSRKKDPNTATSRYVSLLSRAIISGTWSTGARINVDTCITELLDLLAKTPYTALTPKAQSNVTKLAPTIPSLAKMGDEQGWLAQ